MPACASVDRAVAARSAARWRQSVVAAVALALATDAALGAGFAVSAIQARAAASALHVNGSLDLSLTPKVEEAVGKGIPIQLVVDLQLYRQRPLIWDKRIESWTLRRELSYHALSGQYLIGGVSAVPVDRESFTALNEALAELGTLDDVTLHLEAPLAANAAYRLEARVRLDIEALPPLLRPVAYTSSDWDLNSEWTAWKVQH